jgi:peptidoglycan/LPS O-acetylase OafA/YrhL
LLFTEYKKRGEVRIKRFLIRRGFKIYPPFYFFLVVSIAIHWYQTHSFHSLNLLLSELFYVQSYFPGIWIHTWSLAVEEHFYILLSVLVFLAVKYKNLGKTTRVITFLAALIVLSFAMRTWISWPHRNDASFGFVQSHLRADGIIIGVLISYLYHFTHFSSHFWKNKYLYLTLGVALIVPGFVFKGGSFFMNTWGLTLVNLGFGIFTLLAINTPVFEYRWNSAISSVVAFIGIHSYSIYLWHVNLLHFTEKFFPQPSVLSSLIFLVTSVLVGAFFSVTIEKPFLRLRDRWVKL